MSEWVFRGTSALALDAKGRINVPVRHRDPLVAACNGQLTLTRHPEGYLLLYPRPTWEAVEAELMALKAASDGWRRIFLGSAVDVEIDSAARLLVPPELPPVPVKVLGCTAEHEAAAAETATVASSTIPHVLRSFIDLSLPVTQVTRREPGTRA